MENYCRSTFRTLFLLVFASQACFSGELPGPGQLTATELHSSASCLNSGVSSGSLQVSKAGWRADKSVEIPLGRDSQANEIVIHEPGATFIKVHFGKFILPNGVTVEVSDSRGTEVYSYSATKTSAKRSRKSNRTMNTEQGDNGYTSFSAMSISGDTAVVRVLGDRSKINAPDHRVIVDYYMVGYPEKQQGTEEKTLSATWSSPQATRKPPKSQPKSQCGSNDRVDAVCYESSRAVEYANSMPVVKILIDGNKYCTAWRVGPDNRLFTAEHCIESEAEVASTEVWFDYERPECGQSPVSVPVKVTGNQWLASDWLLDYTLFTVSDFELISDYGHLGLEIGDLFVGDRVYIPQHGGGLPKQLAIESDMNVSGECEVDDSDIAGLDFLVDSDIGYFCDTRNGSSGSPVILQGTDRVIAMHHLGGCFNKGSKMSLIWPEVSQFFGGVVPGGGDGTPTPNQAPSAAFEFSCNELSCDFDGSGSSDADGQVVGFSWDFGDGGGGSGSLVSHTFPSEGIYTVALTVEDDDGALGSSEVSVEVDTANLPPSAAFSVNCNGTLCDFDAGLSSDNDGEIVNYVWDFGDGFAAQSPEPTISHEFSDGGDYLVSLEVVDDQGLSATAEAVISVVPPVVNNPPVAEFSFVCDGLQCSFDATASTDSDGEVTGYAWDFGDGSEFQGSTPFAEHEFAQEGSYEVTLTVSDDLGASGQFQSSVTVNSPPPPPNEAPIATYSFTCTDLDCVFDASGSSDPDGTIAAYLWDFDQGEASEAGGPVKNHSFANAGQYNVQLEIEDDEGAKSTHTSVVTVTEPVPPEDDPIQLSVEVVKYRGSKWTELSWSEASGPTVSVYRDGMLKATVANNGYYEDIIIAKKLKSAVYQVCETVSDKCSEEITVKL